MLYLGMSYHVMSCYYYVMSILHQYKQKPKRTIIMYNKAIWDDICTETEHISELYFKRYLDIYTIEDDCLFIQTSIENQIKKWYLVD